MTLPQRAYTPSTNVAHMRESATIAVSQRAKALRAQGRTIIDLGAGEPDFATPPSIRRAAEAAVEAGATHYTATQGTLELRTAIAAAATARRGRGDVVTADDVVVSAGSKQSLFNACFCLFGPGDDVLIPTPAWTSYYEMVGLARARAVPVLGDPAAGFRVTASDLERHATAATRGVMLNSPVNPTGAAYPRDAFADILRLAEARGWWVLSDEIYLRIAYEAPAISALDVAGSLERLVLVDGVAKAYAMTGWRIGWTVSSRALAKGMTALQSHTTFNPAAVSQAAALAALTGGREVEDAVASMVAQFRARRDAARTILRSEPAIAFIPPEAAFYFFMRAPGNAPDAGTAFASRLLDAYDVAVVPGAAFGTPQWFRASYATDLASVEEGMRRIVAAYRAS